MATYKIFDLADEFRIEVVGRLTGEAADTIRRVWEEALKETTPRRVSIDISRLSGYDASGRKLLAEMYRHGLEFAARTPSSLVFLNEIANTPRTAGRLITAPMATKQDKTGAASWRAVAARG